MKTSRGYILIEALIAIAGLLALLAILVSNETTKVAEVQYNLDETRAEACADGAVQQALAVLSTQSPDLVTVNDPWAQLGGVAAAQGGQGTEGTEEFDFPDGTSYREQIIDASSLINLNTATLAQLDELPLDQDQVDSLLDWIQPGENARPDGAKDSFYNSLPTPYNAKLGPLTTVNELLLVDNWTAQTLYQPPTDSTILPLGTDSSGNTLPLAALFTVDSGSPNVSATGSTLTNINTRGISIAALTRAGISAPVVREIVLRSPIPNFTILFGMPGVNSTQRQVLLNSVTFSPATRSTGKINLNTATLPVLESIPQLTNGAASTIVSQQSSGFTTLGQLATSGGLSTSVLGQVAGDFTVGSDTWVVRAYGQSGDVGEAVEAVVGYRNNLLQIVSMTRMHTPGIPTWWGWDTATTSTQQAGVTQ
jgi:DNA uptake protein ComE-like DNA-binding protein